MPFGYAPRNPDACATPNSDKPTAGNGHLLPDPGCLAVDRVAVHLYQDPVSRLQTSGLSEKSRASVAEIEKRCAPSRRQTIDTPRANLSLARAHISIGIFREEILETAGVQ